MALERGQNCMLGARAGALEGVAGEDLLPGPRDEDDVRVEAQWQEHVCRSNLVSGVSARVEGRGAESLCLLALGQGLPPAMRRRQLGDVCRRGAGCSGA